MSEAAKRQRRFLRQGNGVVSRFLDSRGALAEADNATGDFTDARLNLFYTNITTLQSMLYGATPKIDVSREHADPDDDVARVAALMYQRILQADVAPSGADLPTSLKAALQDRLLPGLGLCRLRYEMESTTVPAINPMTLQVEQKDVVTFEDAPSEYVHWQDFRWGWARTWAEVPWIAFRAYMDEDDAEARFGEKVAESLTYKDQMPVGSDDAASGLTDENKSNVEKAEIWEIWCKKERKVFWWSEGADLILDAEEDPLGLDGFWPMPRPLAANLSTTLFMPKADYTFAQDLYNQIDTLYTRITIITRAVKVVGVYDASENNSVGRMLNEGVDNDLIPVDSWAMFAEKGGLKGVIDWFPVQDVVSTMATLRQILGEVIELLYQVTGMSDILRGANTDQYTSDGTNQLKARFGSIRIQALQDEFARFASDLQEIKAEIISKHFDQRTIVTQSSAKFLPEPDRKYIQPALELMKSQDVKWRVDIRPESIAMIDYAQLKSERTEFLTGMATFIQSAGALSKEIPEAMPTLMEMLKWAMAGFKGSNYLEGIMDTAIDAAKKAPPKGDQAGKAQAQQAQMQMQLLQLSHKNDMEKIQAKSQADMQVFQAKLQGELQKIQMDNQAAMQEYQAKSRADIQKIMEDLAADLKAIAANREKDLAIEEAQSTMAIAEDNTAAANEADLEDQRYRNELDLLDRAHEIAEDEMEGESGMKEDD